MKKQIFPCSILLAAMLAITAFGAVVYHEPGVIAPPVDGRLMFGNGYVLGAFVGPLEMPEKPIYEVHHKLSRLWMGYASPPNLGIGLAPVITDTQTGRSWTVGGADHYRYEEGVMTLETELPIGKMITETYGLWQKPVFVRRIRFVPKAGKTGRYRISTTTSLFAEHSNAKPDESDKEAMRFYNVYPEERERPVSYAFPKKETITYADGRIYWTYDDCRYRKVALMAAEPTAEMMFVGYNPSGESGRSGEVSAYKTSTFDGTDWGGVRLENQGDTLTVVMAFDRTMLTAKNLLNDITPERLAVETTRKHWRDWFESGAVVKTGDTRLDTAYETQLMTVKMALDEELGGHVVGARYQPPTMWGRDSLIAMSTLLDAGHYDDAEKMLLFYRDHMAWNERNNCIHANFHVSGRVIRAYCAPGQEPVEDLLAPGEWTNQMRGPQLDAMAYFLYDIAKYYRYTHNKAFMDEIWPFVLKVGNGLAENRKRFYEGDVPSGYYDENRMFDTYREDTGLIVDNCWESDILGEYSLMNGLSIVGFEQAYRTSVALGDPQPLWHRHSQELEKAFSKYLIRHDKKGEPYILKQMPREFMLDWKMKPAPGETPLDNFGYGWTIAATVPLFNYTDETFRRAFANVVDPKGDAAGWGMWWATTAHAAFEADLPDTGWNYLDKYVAQLPESKQAYEHYQYVEGLDGKKRRATLDLFSFAYLPHAILRGMAGFGYNEAAGHWFFRPQVPDEIGAVKSRIKIGDTWFEVTSGGKGSVLAEFTVDGEDLLSSGGILDPKFIDGKTHKISVRMSH